MATYDNAQQLKLCTPRDTYPGGLCLEREGAPADIACQLSQAREPVQSAETDLCSE